MTMSSLDASRAAEQVSPTDTTPTLALAALLMTSAVLTIVVGVFALSTNDLVVPGPATTPSRSPGGVG
jgi:hypothetical protein